MAKPYPTIETQVRNRPGVARRAPPPLPPTATLSVPFGDVPNDPANDLAYTFDVVRSGDLSVVSDATWTVVPGAGSPIPASYFGDAYPTGTVHWAAGQGRQSGIVRVPAGAALATDTFADIVLSGFSGCRAGPTTTWPIRAPGSVAGADALVSVSMPIVVLTRAASVDDTYTVVVTRSGNTGVACSVRVAMTGAGAHPVTAADFVGGLLDQAVDFAAGDTERQLAVTVVHGPDPATDLTGVVALSAPVGCKTNPAVSSVAVKIPKAATITPGILPPEYLDPNFAGMTAYAPAPTDAASLRAACAALSGSAQCFTTYVELAPGFSDTGTIALPYSGNVQNPGAANEHINPLIVCSPRAAIGDRTKVAQLGHFRHLDLNGAQWLWVHGLAAEFPLNAGTPPVQTDNAPAIELDGSTDCLVTRCWLDAPCAIHTQNAVRPRVGGNDLYGTPDTVGNANWITSFYAQFNGGPHTLVKRTLRAYIYQNLFGMLRPPALEVTAGGSTDGSGAFYAGDGVAPDQGYEGTYPSQPYDLNWRESWFFNNLIISTKNFLIYMKHACNLYRNRVVSIKNWTDVTGTGNAFHLIAVRGGNVLGDDGATKCSFRYNVVEADRTPATHCDVQGWKTEWLFNDFGGCQVNLYMHCGRSGQQAGGKVYKTLLAGSYSRFAGNLGGVYVVGSSRPDSGYGYFAPVLDCQWEGEGGAAWTWEGTDQGVVASPNGTAIAWGAGKNTETFYLTFPGDTPKVGCAAGQLAVTAGTAKVAELPLAYAGNGFTKPEKGIASREGLVWDLGGDGGGGGGNPGDPVDPWWRIPGGNRSGKLWNRGPGLTFAASAWTPTMGAFDVLSGGAQRTAGGGLGTMDLIIGGPVSADLTSYDNVANIMGGSQVDWSSGTNMGQAVRNAVAGKTWVVWVMDTNPVGGSLDTNGKPNTTVWSTWAQPGPHDDGWYAMGRRARAAMLSFGLRPWQLMLRINHEMVQSNNYQIFYGNGPDYAKAMGRFMDYFRRGYTAHSADDYPRMIFSPSRHLDCGPLERFFTCDPAALTTPYDLVDVSAHPAGTMNKYDTGYTFAQQVAQVNTWIQGGNDPGRATSDLPSSLAAANYAQNCSVADHSMIKLAKKYKIGMCNSEWSPRYEPSLMCTVSAAVHQAMHDWFTANAPWYAFECVFHSNTLSKTVPVPNWSAGVDKFVALWTGDPAEKNKAPASFNPGSIHTGKLVLA